MKLNFDQITDMVEAIKSDEALSEAFVQVLKFGSSSQQVRVQKLKEVLSEQGAPENLLNFIELLVDPVLATQVLNVIDESAD